MNTSIPFVFIAVIFILVGIAFYTLLITRNMIKIVIALQLLVKGAMIALVLAGRYTNQSMLSQSLALTVIVADTIVAVLGLSLAVQVRKHYHSLDIGKLTNLKR